MPCDAMRGAARLDPAACATKSNASTSPSARPMSSAGTSRWIRVKPRAMDVASAAP